MAEAYHLDLTLIEGKAEHCISCGAVIPEGRMTCPACDENKRILVGKEQVQLKAPELHILKT